MGKLKIYGCIIGLFLLSNASAQDPHFSQFFSSPLTLNPAFTGKFFGTVRLAGNYRNQWPSINNAFTTTTASIDFHILQNNIAPNDTWGVGFMGYTDNSANGAVKFNYAGISTAYHKGLDEDGHHQLGAGFQVTYANMLINTANLNFEDQLTSSGFTGVTSEVFNNATLQSNYIDVNAGILYNGSTDQGVGTGLPTEDLIPRVAPEDNVNVPAPLTIVPVAAICKVVPLLTVKLTVLETVPPDV